MEITVIKIGGSVLVDGPAYRRAAAFIAARVAADPDRRLVVVVSAQSGMTNALLEAARELTPEPEATTLDLLWSTGEIRSVALLTLALHALGVRAAALNAHQTGLLAAADAPEDRWELQPLRIRSALARSDVVVVPGFFARNGDTLVSLGRGGSDLSAVLLAAGLAAGGCEIVKDVDGYFSGDPHRVSDARPVAELPVDRALEMARAGCPVVQSAALEAARRHRVRLVVRSMHGAGTVVGCG